MCACQLRLLQEHNRTKLGQSLCATRLSHLGEQHYRTGASVAPDLTKRHIVTLALLPFAADRFIVILISYMKTCNSKEADHDFLCNSKASCLQ